MIMVFWRALKAKKKVEKLTVQAAKEEAEKAGWFFKSTHDIGFSLAFHPWPAQAIEEAAGNETTEAKEEAGKACASNS